MIASSWSVAGGVLAGVIVALAAWTVFAFNRLVRERNLLREAWSGIDVQLKRRSELVPNLVECVRGYSRYERSVLERIAELRAQVQTASDLKQREGSENALGDQIRQLFALAEAYPDLKANRNFLDLQKQLAQIEDQLQMARRYYNGWARNYNIRVESFPSSLVARGLGFRAAEFFELATATERAAPRVEVSP